MLLHETPSPRPSSSRRRSSQPTKTPDDVRRKLLKENKPVLRRFAAILLPTLTDAFTSTVNLSVRQKVLTAQLKMISNLEKDVLEHALSNIKFASHLATILSQQDQQSLVVYGLHAAELLLRRLPEIYRSQFYREGVFAEVQKLADKAELETSALTEAPAEQNEESDESQDEEDREQDASSPVSSRSSSPDPPMVLPASMGGASSVAQLAKTFIEKHEKDATGSDKAETKKIMDTLTKLAQDLQTSKAPRKLFEDAANFFKSDESLESITSFELLGSGIVDALLSVLENTTKEENRRAFLEVFMINEGEDDTPFAVLVKKLQDLLSRSEHFEIITVHRNYDGNRSSASMLAKQLRLKLTTDESSDIPKNYRNIMVSIHAIATFKALEDYLKPRIQIQERAKNARASGGLQGALAAFAAAAGLPAPPPAGSPLAPGGGSSATQTPTSKDGKPARASRRSSRNKATDTPKAAAASAPLPKESPRAPATPPIKDNQLECMDEQASSMPEDDPGLDDLDAVLDDLDHEMDDDVEPPATTVDMDLAEKKPPSRKDTKSAPPTEKRPSARPTASATSSPRPTSYSAALQSPQGEWHIEFSINGRKIPNDMTIYKAVQLEHEGMDDSAHRNVWSSLHTVKFERVPGPPPPDSPLSTATDSPMSETIPASLDKNKVTASILRLLSVLHALNANIDDVFAVVDTNRPRTQPLSLFVNTKLTAKLNRQLEEPLMVASNCLPTWSEDLARYYPFLFPFETRHLYLQSTSFGYSRSMSRWQNIQQTESRQGRDRDDHRPFLGRPQRQKVRISRDRMLESAIKVMEIYGASPSVLEVEYFEEVGTGLGPTLEFYSSVSRAFVSKKLKLWRDNDFNNDSEYAFGQQGLFPAPMDEKAANTESGKKVLHLFEILGKFVARSMLDSRIIDIFFNPTFFRVSDNCDRAVVPSLGAVKSVDKDLAKSLQLLRKFAILKKDIDDNNILTPLGKQERYKEIKVDGAQVEDLSLDFTLPGYPGIELVPDGSNVPVTIHNVGEYVDKVVDMTLADGVRRQVAAFRQGFSQVFPYGTLRTFTPDELVMLFGQVEEDWSLESM